MSERTERTPEQARFLQQIRDLITEFRAKRGQIAKFGNNLLLLTTVGARTEQLRTVPLVFSTDADRYVVAATNGGSARHPHWLHNLIANPTVWIEIGDRRIEAKASIPQGADRERLFNLHAERVPELPEHQAKALREIPIVILEPKLRA
jgi:deazaflavin-dependent oxidoreductase (nitroreductase family)